MEFADRNAIENLIFRYTRYVDTCQWLDLGELFAAAVITANKTDQRLEGAEFIGNYWKNINKQYDNGTLNTQHVVTNLEFDDLPNGDVSVHSALPFCRRRQTCRCSLSPPAAIPMSSRRRVAPGGTGQSISTSG
jgi:hypothetical protein